MENRIVKTKMREITCHFKSLGWVEFWEIKGEILKYADMMR